VFAAWEPPKQFINGYAWRGSDLYHVLVRDPQNDRLKKLPPWTQLRYAEIRALVGGGVAIQGSGDQATQYQDEALVRNVDKWIFGGQVGRAMIDLPSPRRGMDQFTSIIKDISAGKIKAFYIHLAEGKSTNKVSTDELGKLEALGGLLPQTVIIHGTALSEAQLDRVRAAQAKLVWSPQSNLRLYGETTKAAYARSIGIPVALGADWLPSAPPACWQR
jgi:5-methylthioadenosine/S-adenosylhomocysteine deaminase